MFYKIYSCGLICTIFAFLLKAVIATSSKLEPQKGMETLEE
jgi:hypothetical protein